MKPAGILWQASCKEAAIIADFGWYKGAKTIMHSSNAFYHVLRMYHTHRNRIMSSHCEEHGRSPASHPNQRDSHIVKDIVLKRAISKFVHV